MQLEGELERVYRGKLQDQAQENDELRDMCHHLKYELLFVKSQYEHKQAENQQILQEIKTQHDAEISNLRKDRKTAIQQLHADSESRRVRDLQRENFRYSLTVRSLKAEVKEVRSERETTIAELESRVRGQARNIAEKESVIKALQVERDSQRQHIAALLSDHTSYLEDHNKLIKKVHELETENIVYRNRVEELSHQSKLDMADLRMVMVKQNGELEREGNRLRNVVEGLKVQLEIQDHVIQQQNQALADKERETVWRLQAMREEEFLKATMLENEKTEISRDQETMSKMERLESENLQLKKMVSVQDVELNRHVDDVRAIKDDNVRLKRKAELLTEELDLTREFVSNVKTL